MILHLALKFKFIIVLNDESWKMITYTSVDEVMSWFPQFNHKSSNIDFLAEHFCGAFKFPNANHDTGLSTAITAHLPVVLYFYELKFWEYYGFYHIRSIV